MSNKATEPVTAAERMRRLRTRQRNGLRYMRILLHETEIDSLINRGFLKEERRHDPDAVQQAMARHGILKSTRGPLGGYELAREQRRITADEILRAAGTADETDRTPVPQSALLNSVVMPAVEQAGRAFSTALARINIEVLAHSAAELPTQEPERTGTLRRRV
jgi:DNA-binding IscR family transcriptional regulator